MEQQDPMFEDTSANQAKVWIQENLRIIVSVFIVAAIALGIYSYSQRAQTPVSDDTTTVTSETPNDQGIAGAEQGLPQTSTPSSTAANEKNQDVSPELSRETETAFIEQAVRGNGTTHLARRALAHYLEKNPDSSLSMEHKIYIEDYLRKHSAFRGHVTTKTSVEFSKDLIRQGIEKSKTLNTRQLQHLKQFSARVSTFR